MTQILFKQPEEELPGHSEESHTHATSPRPATGRKNYKLMPFRVMVRRKHKRPYFATRWKKIDPSDVIGQGIQVIPVENYSGDLNGIYQSWKKYVNKKQTELDTLMLPIIACQEILFKEFDGLLATVQNRVVGVLSLEIDDNDEARVSIVSSSPYDIIKDNDEEIKDALREALEPYSDSMGYVLLSPEDMDSDEEEETQGVDTEAVEEINKQLWGFKARPSVLQKIGLINPKVPDNAVYSPEGRRTGPRGGRYLIPSDEGYDELAGISSEKEKVSQREDTWQKTDSGRTQAALDPKVRENAKELESKLHSEEYGGGQFSLGRMQEIFSMGNENYRTNIKRVSASEDDFFYQIGVQMEIQSSDGENVGYAQRKFVRDKEAEPGKDWQAWHEHFDLDSKHQGNGIGSDFVNHVEDQYMKMGVYKINLIANADVGGYAWAMAGYDFKDSEDEDVLELKSEAESMLHEAYTLSASGQIKTQVPAPGSSRFKTMVNQVYNMEHSWEFAMWNPFNAAPGKQLGKRLMLGSIWSGTKILDEENDTFKIGQAYRQQRQNWDETKDVKKESSRDRLLEKSPS